MDRQRAIELLKQKSKEAVHIARQPFNANEFIPWRRNIEDILESAFGVASTEYKRVADLHFEPIRGTIDELRRRYVNRVFRIQQEVDSIIQKHELLGIEEKPAVIAERPKAFIAHGGESPSLNKLKEFLEALGVEPLVVEEQPSEGRSVGENVDWCAKQADCAIILATKGDIDGKTGGFIPRGNVLIEIGKSQELFEDRIIYLLQAGTKFPTNISEKVWGRFTTQRMDDALVKIARELKKFGILRAVKPKRRGVDV